MNGEWVRQWTQRPLFACATAFILGYTARLEPLLFLLLFLLVPLIVARFSRWWTLAGCVLGLLLAPVTPLQPVRMKRPFAGEIQVVSVARGVKGGSEVDVLAGGLKCQLTAPEESQINQGDILLVTGEIGPPSPFHRPILAARGVSGVLRVSSIDKVVRAGPGWFKLGAAVRSGFRDFASASMSREPAALVRSVCFNDDSDLPKSLRANLVDSGTVHIISTSGLHVALLSGILFGLFRKLPIPRWAQIALLGMVLLPYVAAAGWRPPAVRSMILVVGVLLPYMVKRQPDALSWLSLGFLITVIADPHAPLSPSTQLSYAALLGLVFFVRWPRSGRFRDQALAVGQGTLAVSATTLPLTAFHFGQISLMGPFANPLIEFVLPVMVGVSLLAWVVGVPALMQWIIEPLANYVRLIAEWASSPSWAVVQVPSFSGWWLAVYYGLLCALWHPQVRPKDS